MRTCRSARPVWLLLALSLAACERPVVPPPDPEADEWTSAVVRRVGWIRQRDFYEVWPPQAVNGFDVRRIDFDMEGVRPRFNLIVNAEGRARSRGREYEIASADPEKVSLEIGALREHLHTLARSGREAGSTGTDFVLFADRDAPWMACRGVLTLFGEMTTDIHRLQLVVKVPASGLETVLSWRIARLTADDRADAVLQFEKLPSSDAVRARTLTEAFDFPAPHDLQDPVFLREASRRWREIRGALRDAAATGASGRIELGEAMDKLPWAYVVKALDLFVGAGFTTIDLAQAELRLTDAHPPLPPLRVTDHGLPGVLAVAACIAAAVILAWLTLRPLRQTHAWGTKYPAIGDRSRGNERHP